MVYWLATDRDTFGINENIMFVACSTLQKTFVGTLSFLTSDGADIVLLVRNDNETKNH